MKIVDNRCYYMNIELIIRVTPTRIRLDNTTYKFSLNKTLKV